MPFNEFFRRFLAVLFVLLLWAGIWAARSTLILGFAAALIAVAVSILSVWLQRHGWRRGLAILGSLVVVGIVAIFLLLLVLPRLLNEFGHAARQHSRGHKFARISLYARCAVAALFYKQHCPRQPH